MQKIFGKKKNCGGMKNESICYRVPLKTPVKRIRKNDKVMA